MASSATSSLIKPLRLSTPNCSTTISTLPPPPFFFKPLLSFLPSKSIHLSSKSSSWASQKPKNSWPLLVAQTSDWAQQEEEEEEEEEQEEQEEQEDGGELVGAEANEAVEEFEVEQDSEPSEEAKLFVGNLPYDYDSEKLAQLFNQAGVVEIAEVIYNRQTDQSRGFGFVTMSTVEEAEKAVEMFNRYDASGRFLTVNKAAPRGTQPERPPRVYEPSFRIYVGNLPWQMDNSRLEQLFSEHGKVVDARVVVDRETGRSRGFGFVSMASETELNDAIAALDGQSLDGRAIRVNVAEERPRRSFF